MTLRVRDLVEDVTTDVVETAGERERTWRPRGDCHAAVSDRRTGVGSGSSRMSKGGVSGVGICAWEGAVETTEVTAVLKGGLLWVKCCHTVSCATEEPFVKGRVN